MARLLETPRQIATPTSQKAGGYAGIVFAVLIAIDLFLPSVSYTDPVADIREFFVDTSSLLLAVGWAERILFTFVLLFFAACLRDTLAWPESVPTEFARLAFAGAIVTAAVGTAIALPWMALAFSEAAVDDGLLRYFLQMDIIAYGAVIGFGMALMATAASVVILRTGVLSRWLGWLGLFSSALMVVGGLWLIGGDESGPPAMVAFTGVGVWLVWTLGVGIDMVRRTRSL